MSDQHTQMDDYPVRIFVLEDGQPVDTREEYCASDFAALPGPGDIIVSPWAVEGAQRSDPRDRTFHEVVRRYFCPTSEKPTWVMLVVNSRAGTLVEADVCNN